MTKLMLVDDDELLRAGLAEILSRAGYEVSCASNGREASQLYRRFQAEVVVTDIIMPEKDGLEVLTELRSSLPRPKLVAISGGGRMHANRYLQFASYMGAARVMSKPFSADELLVILEELLGVPRMDSTRSGVASGGAAAGASHAATNRDRKEGPQDGS